MPSVLQPQFSSKETFLGIPVGLELDHMPQFGLEDKDLTELGGSCFSLDHGVQGRVETWTDKKM